MKPFQSGKSPRRLGLALGLCLLWLGTIPTRAQDFQSWNEVDVVTNWRHVEFLVPLLARTDPAKANPQLAAIGLLANVMLPWGLAVTPGYLFADLPQGHYQVHLPVVVLTKTGQVGPIRFVDGNRFERLFGYPKEPVRYRNLFLVDCAVDSRLRAHVFLGDEVFFDLSAADYNQNRFQTGAGVALNHRMLLDLFYLQKNPAGGTAIHAFGTRLTVNLKPHARDNASSGH